MRKHYSRKKQRHLEMYFRCLSSFCNDSLLTNYYLLYEFHPIERWLRNHLLKQALVLWDIKDAASLKERIRWLLDDGGRMEYKELHHQLLALTEAARRRYIETAEDDLKHAKRKVVHTFLPQLPSGEIAAFGGGWAIYLSRVGLAYGYLTKEEAWIYKIEAARYIQQHYSSWGEYITAIAAGNIFKSSDKQMTRNRPIINMASSFLGRSTLVKKVVWEQDLQPDKAVSLPKQEQVSV
ncbi:protein chain release factor A [Brevibacillus panacihumi W25]|uniref:Protein chain release factor A n=1 Tax=Brevibacillus panacihumi W25 TaxID=1408254 RepID=V6MEE5_9BACL|nr:DUF1266 domain-containing protein [Brevibacillus panacihumi]EST56602.1 protein chain release factor A [Brevibacillus panacihumi W25]